MKLIPAIDLMNGKCVRLFKGDFNKRKDFSKEPHEQAKYWENEGAKCIHIVDLDAAKTGFPTNDQSIKEIVKRVNIPIQIGGGIRSIERIEQLFSLAALITSFTLSIDPMFPGLILKQEAPLSAASRALL